MINDNLINLNESEQQNSKMSADTMNSIIAGAELQDLDISIYNISTETLEACGDDYEYIYTIINKAISIHCINEQIYLLKTSDCLYRLEI